MKKLSFILALVLCSCMAMAQNGRIDLRSKSRAEILNSNFSSLRAVFSYGSIEGIEVNTEKGVFTEIGISGTYPSGEIGTPELPASHQMLAVPFGATPSVSVVRFTTTDYKLSDYGINTIYPHQESVRKDAKPEDIHFAYNEAAYQASKALASAPEVSIEVQGTLRGIRVGSLVINPLSYNASTNTLRVFNDIEVEVNFEGANYEETKNMLLNTYSPYFDVVYKEMFNYRQILDVYTEHPDLMAYPVRMIVVANDMFQSALQPWIDWKTQKGFYMDVNYTSTVGTTAAAIKTFLQNKYNNGVQQGQTPTFVVIVGDKGQVPASATGNQSQKVTDLYYGSVDNDYFPDMFYSRMSVETTSQLTALVNKILQYEQYTMPDPSYLNNVTLIAGWDSYWNPKVAQPTINYATTYYYNAQHGFNNVNTYLTQGQYSGCYTTLNTGVGFINYTAHGSETSWADPSLTVSGVNGLSNSNKYFLAMGNCCLAADWGYSGTCFGEAMVRAENKAAYSYIGSCPSTYWYEDYYFGVGATHTLNGPTPSNTESTTGVYDAVWMDDTYNTVSSMVFVGNLAVCYVHTGGYQTHSNPTYYWQAYHVLGDGSIMPYRVQPTANNVSHANTFPAGATSFTVNAQAGSYVGISKDNVLLGAALVPASGSVSVPVTAVSSGQVKIVVTKPQRQPYSTTISVGGGGGQTTYTITTSANPTNGGTTSGGGTFNQGASCTVHATANSGYTFTNWTENGTQVSTNANYTFTVNGNRNLVANFTQNVTTYTITTSANPTNGGTTSGGGTFNQGASCTVHATANSGYTFTNWTENGTQVSTNANYTFTVNGNRNLVANFTQQTYTITTSSNPTSGGTTTGGGTYNQGASCTVTATANQGYTFQKWMQGSTQVSTNPSYTFTVTGNRNLVAYFVAETFTIGVEASDPSMGTVTGGGTFNYGQTCGVSASAKPNYTFTNWTENGTVVSTNNFYTFSVTHSCTLVANFAAANVEINATADPVEGGTIEGAGTYDMGETVTLEAIPAADYNFVNWTENGQIVSEEMVYEFVATSSRNLVAHFAIENAVGEHIQGLMIYPNPAQDKLNIESSSAISSVKIYNMVGAEVYSKEDCGTQTVISLDDMPNGVYFIQLNSNGTIETTRFIKE